MLPRNIDLTENLDFREQTNLIEIRGGKSIVKLLQDSSNDPNLNMTFDEYNVLHIYERFFGKQCISRADAIFDISPIEQWCSKGRDSYVRIPWKYLNYKSKYIPWKIYTNNLQNRDKGFNLFNSR